MGEVVSRDQLGARGAVARQYKVYVPDSYDPERPAPMIFYGGGFGDAIHQSGYHDLRRIGELYGAVVVDIQQRLRDWGKRGYRHGWYVYGEDSQYPAYRGDWEQSPDVDFVAQVIEELKSRYNIDRTRVFFSGTSRGGGVSIMLAFMLPDLIAGFASEAGFLSPRVNNFEVYIRDYAARGGRKMPAVFVHGNRDDNVPSYESSYGDALFRELGWEDEDRLMYLPVAQAGHAWQPYLTQTWWDFLMANPLPLEEAAP